MPISNEHHPTYTTQGQRGISWERSWSDNSSLFVIIGPASPQPAVICQAATRPPNIETLAYSSIDQTTPSVQGAGSQADGPDIEALRI